MSGNTNPTGLVINSTLPLSFSNGGLGFNTTTTGDLFYGSGTNTPGKLAAVATGRVLISGGIGVAPSYSTSPTLTGLNLSGLTVSSLVATDGSNNLTSSVTALTPNFAGLKLGTITSAVTTNTKLNLFGTDSSSTTAPGIGFFTSGGSYPLLTITPYTLGNTAISWGAYFTGTWLSSGSANYQITDSGTQLNFNVSSGVAAGGTITWTTALVIDQSAHINFASPGISASSLIALDASKNVTNTTSGLSPTFTGLNLGGLTASSLVATDGSKNLTSSVSGLSPTLTGLNLSGLTASYVLTTDASKNLASSNTARVYPFGTSTASVDSNSDTAMTLISSGANSVAQLAIGNSTKNNFIMLWSGRSSDVNPVFFWSSSTDLRLGTSTAGSFATTGFSQLFIMKATGDFIAAGTIQPNGIAATGIVTTDASKNLASVAAASTYTPTIGDGTNNFTTSTAQGRYYKIGSFYSASIEVVWSSKASAVAGSTVVISLPAASAVTDPVAGTIGYASGVSYTSGTLFCANGGNAATVSLYSTSTGGVASAALTVSQMSASGELIINVNFWSI